MLGITPLPERIVFRCRRCGKSLGVSRDPALLRKRGMPDAVEPKPAEPDAPRPAPEVAAAPEAEAEAEAGAKGGSSPL
jgi:hypothetical protein